ncbi:L-aminoadipate-semialdehyde dehydrogenase-phosphopantetheinyl transferase [Portunus trituberculatus]|uniref:L-aminoadipate-semialdehyde dehydrogenase-phosphopantetheinyl transferase n=1 Tax=Portunus trituberculatus TaxID=210409 RepID=A0A5B7FQB0_PORTR|nr:L-aminoadipate-semialdehyde dehydrogenase-phosphopantetheinyl transferase [Portunus trituberculatus]
MEGGVRWAFNTRRWRPSAGEWAAALALVQAEEKERIGRFMFRRDAKAALAGRLLLRKLAADILGIPWGTVALERTEHGRPCLVAAQAVAVGAVDFNVSHQGAYAVLAAAAGMAVGVDVMEVRPPPGRSIDIFLASMRRQLSLVEWDHVRAFPDEHRRLAAFYRLWCLKEAVIKARGDGLTFALQRLSLTPAGPTPTPPPGPLTLDTTLAIDGVHDPAWYFQETMLDPTHPVAVALHCPALASAPPPHNAPRATHFTELTYDQLTSSATPLTPLDLGAGQAFMAKAEAP